MVVDGDGCVCVTIISQVRCDNWNNCDSSHGRHAHGAYLTLSNNRCALSLLSHLGSFNRGTRQLHQDY